MINAVILIGRVVADPELRHTTNDVPVTSFTLAVDRNFFKAGTERQTDFIDIVAWRNNASFASKYFHKGQLVAVQGSIQTGSYVDKQGTKRRTFEILADSLHFAEPKRDYNKDEMPVDTTLPTESGSGSEAISPEFSNGSDGDFMEITSDDDLPF